MEKFAQVSWNANDIHTLRENWTQEQCEEFLTDIESGLADITIQRGWDYISDRLPEE